VISNAFIQAVLQASIIGAVGGVGLVLTQIYSRRGPLIYPVYAAILFALTLSLSRATGVDFSLRYMAAFVAMGLSTGIAMIGTMFRAARARRELVASGRSVAPGQIPPWAAPLLLVLLCTASAAAAFVSM
jgi:hypothetical protein